MYSYPILSGHEWFDERKPELLTLCSDHIDGNFSLTFILRGNTIETAVPTIFITYANLKIDIEEFKALIQGEHSVNVEILECRGWGWGQ